MSHGRGICLELILRRVGGPDGGRVADWVLKTDFRLGIETTGVPDLKRANGDFRKKTYPNTHVALLVLDCANICARCLWQGFPERTDFHTKDCVNASLLIVSGGGWASRSAFIPLSCMESLCVC